MNDWDRQLKKEEANWQFFWQGLKRVTALLQRLEARNDLFSFWWVVALIVCSQALALMPPLCLKVLFDAFGGEEAFTVLFVWQCVGLYFGVYVVRSSFEHFITERTFFRYIIAIENILPAVAQDKLLELSLGYHEKENTGKKIAKIEKGCLRIIDIMMHLRWGLLPSVFLFAVNAVILFVLNWQMAILFLAAFPLAVQLYLWARKRYWENWEEWDRLKEYSSGLFCQSIIHVPTVQGYVQEDKERSLFWRMRQRMWDVDIEVCVGMQKYFFAAHCLLQLSYVAAVGWGAYLLLHGSVSNGTVVYVLATGSMILQQMGGAVREYMEISKKLISVERLQDLLDERPLVANRPQARTLPSVAGNLSLNNVTFCYDGKHEAVVDNLSIAFSPGKMTAIVGRTGEGKSTVLKLVTRMMDVNDGSIMLDGHDVRELDLFWYRSLFAVVRQEAGIFDGTIRYNVAYSYPDATNEEVREALEASCFEEVLHNSDSFPDELDTQVGERGVQLSGGQRQRVEIARAYLALKRGARFLILDEATSSLDVQTERVVQDVIDRLRSEQNVSLIVCAHRLATIQKADHIYVISDGSVSESGDHEKLMRHNGLYKRLVEMQQLGELVA